MKVSVLVPTDDRPDTPAQAHALSTWARLMPDAEVVRGVNTDTPYNRAAALNAAAKLASGDVLVITDRDLIYPAIRTAVDRVAKGAAPWVIADTLVRLGRVPTSTVQRGAQFNRVLMQGSGTERYKSKGGVLIVPRKAWKAVGGMDERYRGWGGEDTAFIRALRTLVGPPERRGIQWHMWHPSTVGPRIGNTRTKIWHGQTSEHDSERRRLNVDYRDAVGDPKEMRRIIKSQTSLAQPSTSPEPSSSTPLAPGLSPLSAPEETPETDSLTPAPTNSSEESPSKPTPTPSSSEGAEVGATSGTPCPPESPDTKPKADESSSSRARSKFPSPE